SGMASASASIAGADVDALAAPERLAALERRTRHALRGALDALDAPTVPTGSYRVAIDHALAKGLAHEAIGHLCESDVDTSVFFRDGRLRLGERVGAPNVSVVDAPIPGDYAYQAISANGLDRRDAVLVERGVLVGGLADLFSAGSAGIPASGACRAGSFRERPVPRMTNVRIVVDDAVPLDAPPDAIEPEQAASALRRAGLLGEGGPPILYLAGYRGGQADPRRGDFVLAAAVAYDLADGSAPHSGATLSGPAARILETVLAGIGPLQLDAVGTCVKDGWPVSSSGGSHALLVLEASPHLTVGGTT
ncbi:MAG: metallopeptidase TldD-related protein, partial [Chloroflexota bacterium]|nr:metallopeptidase TldD-related protein [Chloroflexota bacterium]